tara:strand:- start:3912 stop:4583 length:672 start_codon:yes stop_codon:yes gene_type:complete
MPHRKSKKIFIYLFLFLVIGTLNNKNINDLYFFKINKISIKGLDEKNNNKLIKDLNFLKFDNLFFLNTSKINEVVSSNNLIENFSVFKKYPSSLEIFINKTHFLAKIKKNDKDFILGSNGRLIAASYETINLPFIFGNFEIENFFKLKKAIDETNLDYNEIKNLYSFKSGRWDIETKDGLTIKLPKNDLRKKIELYLIFISENSKKKVNIIDLRQLNQIIING